jgi:hypothetical protein
MSDQPPPPPPPGPPPLPEPPDYSSPAFTSSAPITEQQYQYGYQPGYPQNRPTNGMAITSLIMGIGGFTFIPFFGSILALVFGYIGKGQIARSQGTQDGKGLATAGIVMGWLGIVFTILLTALLIIGLFAAFNATEGGVGGILDEIEDGVNEGVVGTIDEAAAGCTPIEKHPNDGRAHIDPSEAGSVTYSSDPPTSGPHFAIPAKPGFYSTPVEPATLVHNLEHGQIVVWYAPGADDNTIAQLEYLVAQEPVATIATPYDNLPAGSTYVLTAWRRSRACTLPSQDVFDDFRRRFQGQAPEQIAPPFEG